MNGYSREYVKNETYNVKNKMNKDNGISNNRFSLFDLNFLFLKYSNIPTDKSTLRD